MGGAGTPPLGKMFYWTRVKIPPNKDCTSIWGVTLKDSAKQICLVESVGLTFQNKVTTQSPCTDFTFLQTSGASEGAEMNQRKDRGSCYICRTIQAVSSSVK